ncbi:hypothetical protein [Bacillus sp. AFS040349]|nr:hypothetical protein [Bacillus sp. AFS040349]
MNQDSRASEDSDWVIKFLNLPHPDQIDFLFRHSLDEKARREIEKKTFGE